MVAKPTSAPAHEPPDLSGSEALNQSNKKAEALEQQARELAHSVEKVRQQTLAKSNERIEALEQKARDLASFVETTRQQILSQSDKKIEALEQKARDLAAFVETLRNQTRLQSENEIEALGKKAGDLAQFVERVRKETRSQFETEIAAMGKKARDLAVSVEAVREITLLQSDSKIAMLGQSKEETVAMNEALLLGSVRQHALTEEAEKLNAQLSAEIEERKRWEAALRASEERFRALFASAPMAVFACDKNAVIQHHNQRAVELWGREPACGVEKHCGSVKLWLPNGACLPHGQSPMVEVLRTGIPALNVEVAMERPDGSRLPVLMSFAALKNGQGEITGAIVSFMDITERKRAEEALRESNRALVFGSVRQHELTEAAEKLNAQLQVEVAARQKTAQELAEKARLLDLTIDAIIVRDSEDRILFWNDGAAKLFGWSSAEVFGKPIHALLHTEFPIPREQINEELRQNNHWTGELVQTKRDGQRITVLARKALDRDAQGNPASVLASMTDISERIRSREALRRLQTLLADRAGQLEALVTERTARLQETIGDLEGFSSSITHDLRAPLRALQGFAAMLQASYDGKLDEKGRDYLRRITTAASRMDKLIQDVLVYSRVLRLDLRLEPVAVDPLLRGMLESYPNFQEPEAEVIIEGELPVVLGNEAALTQCFSNLLNNAVKFVPPGTKPRVRISAERRGEMARFWVADNGIGIEPRHFERIFEMFQRLEEAYEGTGIGLTIVRKAVERMGGAVGVESEAGKGSRFWLELKIANQPDTTTQKRNL